MILNMVGKGGGGTVLVSDIIDINGGTIRTITAKKVVKLQTKTITPTTSIQIVDPDTGYDGFSQVTVGSGSGGTPMLQTKIATYTPSTSAITDTITPDAGYDGLDEVDVTVDAVPVGSIIQGYINGDFGNENNTRVWYPRFDFEAYGLFSGFDTFSDMGYYLAVPANTTITPTESAQTVGGNGYMMEGAVTVAAMPSGTAGTPTATKGTVSNHQVSVTPSVTNTTGYITGSTKTGTAVSVSASELVSGTYNVTSAGTKDVTNYASASVPAGSATGPSSLTASSATVSTGTNTITLSKTGVNTTPTVSAGYVASATSSTANVSLTASVTTKAAATITPGTTNQTIASGTYLTGTQTISGDADLVASNIVSGVQIFGVTGNVVLQNYYTGSSAPSSSTGSNGDLYLQT